MSDLYLKADSEAALMAALTDAGLVVEGDVQAVTLHEDGTVTDLYVIGVMYDAEGAPLVGYHANVRTDNQEVIAGLAPLTFVVNTPAYVFA